MNDLNKFHEWPEIGIKKDTETIIRLMKVRSFNFIILIEMVLGILGVVINSSSIIQNDCAKNIVTIIVLSLVFCIPIGTAIFFLVRKYRLKKKDFITGNTYSKQCVDIFDNSINQHIMMAKSMLEYGEAEKSENIEIRKYCFIQVCYYTNKCIFELSKMDNVICEVFAQPDEDLPHRKISYSRIKNIVSLINFLRNESLKKLNIIDDNIDKELAYYNGLLKGFITSYNNFINNNELKLDDLIAEERDDLLDKVKIKYMTQAEDIADFTKENREELQKLKSGVYIFMGESTNDILYVGMISNADTANLYMRLYGNGNAAHIKKKWFSSIKKVKFYHLNTDDKFQMLLLERILISALRPKHNDLEFEDNEINGLLELMNNNSTKN